MSRLVYLGRHLHELSWRELDECEEQVKHARQMAPAFFRCLFDKDLVEIAEQRARRLGVAK